MQHFLFSLQIVHMAHALRRISYATCDPEHSLFSFLAREPRGHFSLQYCHSFITRTPEQVCIKTDFFSTMDMTVKKVTTKMQCFFFLKMDSLFCIKDVS